MFLIDDLLVGGLGFVLDKVARAVDAELNDTGRLREQLLELQMRLEAGNVDEEEYVAAERAILARLRDLREAEGGPDAFEFKVTGADAYTIGDHHDE